MESYSFGHWGPTSEEILKSQFPLHRACRDGDVEELSRLLIVAQNGIYEEDSFYGWTPAHWAAYFGKVPTLSSLIFMCRCYTIAWNERKNRCRPRASFAGVCYNVHSDKVFARNQ